MVVMENNVIIDIINLSNKINKFVIGTEGNISGKINDGSFYIKSSGKSLIELKKSDLTHCDKFGNSLDGTIPSMEVGFHKWILSNYDVNYVSHTHPTNTLKILCSDKIYEFATKRLFPDQVVFNGVESCLVEYYHPGEELFFGIKQSIDNFFNKHNILPKLILLKNHGVITFGKTIEECVLSTEMCEKSAEIFLGSYPNITYLSDVSINSIANDEKEKYRQKLIYK
jgi:ribulose-5-phosphate 4-epimerase/fuculose-1-phosphate aldolase